MALVVIFTHLVPFALITTVLCWADSAPNSNGETPSHSSCLGGHWAAQVVYSMLLGPLCFVLG